MRVAIVGAGGAGLCAGRHCLQEGHSVDIFEQTGNVGGTWNYTDNVGYDENGIPVHSSMYQGLRTNLPKELMAFEDFPYPEQQQSYLPQTQVLAYIRSYSQKFELEPHIKFYKRVTVIEPQDLFWLIQYEDVKTKQRQKGRYDVVIICNGHYADAFAPEISGIDNLQSVKHSHNYRTPDPYKNRRVLVIGAGPSGTDISQHIAKVATKVYLSHKSQLPLPDILVQKPPVVKFVGNIAVFEDGTQEEIDDVLLCTGYNFNFPFLSDKCGIRVDDNYVHPLYKQIINIEHPTMAFIGVPFTVCPFPMFDIQVRFFLATLSGHFKLPSKEELLHEMKKGEKIEKPKRKYHHLGEAQGWYFEDLASTAEIKMVPPVIHNLYLRVRMSRNVSDCFRLVDDETWEQIC